MSVLHLGCFIPGANELLFALAALFLLAKDVRHPIIKGMLCKLLHAWSAAAMHCLYTAQTDLHPGLRKSLRKLLLDGHQYFEHRRVVIGVFFYMLACLCALPQPFPMQDRAVCSARTTVLRVRFPIVLTAYIIVSIVRACVRVYLYVSVRVCVLI